MPETTDALRWTRLRHRMLREVATWRQHSRRRRLRYWMQTRYEASLYTRDGVDLTGPEQRALRQLHNALLVEPVHRGECGSDRELDPTDAGRALLSRWDAEHPEGGER